MNSFWHIGGERPPPLSENITFGENPAYEVDGKWYCKETHEELIVMTLEDLFKSNE